MDMEIQRKIDDLKAFFKDKKVIIAFSGGADSTLLAFVAKNEAKDALAVTVDMVLCLQNLSRKQNRLLKKLG